MSSFGYILRRARYARRWSQQELARASGVSQQAISAYERGYRPDPQLSHVLALARALELDLRRIARELEQP